MSEQTAENREDAVEDASTITTPASDAGADEECPPLVSSDEEEAECPQTPGDMVAKWMEQGSDRAKLMQQVKRIRLQGVGVFLLGLGHVFPDQWITALVSANVLESKERASCLGVMSDRHELITEMFVQIFDANSHVFFPEKSEVMKQVLVMIDAVETHANGCTIPVDDALLIAMQYPFFKEECDQLMKKSQEQNDILIVTGGCLQPIYFTLLFFCKLVHAYVCYYGCNKGTLTDKIIGKIMNRDPVDQCAAKEEGNRKYKEGDYHEAIMRYTIAMKKDYENCYLYGNRAQAYIVLEDYRSALSDSKRAIFVNPEWYKGYYRAAEACYKLGNQHRLEEGLEFNSVARTTLGSFGPTGDEGLRQDIEEQRKRLEQAKHQLVCIPILGSCGHPLTALPSSEEAEEAEELVEKARKEIKAKTKAEGQGAPTASHVQPENGPVSQEQSKVDKFQQYLQDALQACNMVNMVRASDMYEEAIELWNQNTSVKVSMNAEDMIVVRYAFAITSVSQDNSRSLIQKGLQTFKAMHRDGVHHVFPLVLYGLARALAACFRFPEAKEVVETMAMEAVVKSLKPVCWPLSQEIIPESEPDIFKKKVQQLEEECNLPPQPEGLCFEHVDADQGRAIYINSPMSGGLVTMCCYLKCLFRFHLPCWKIYKNRFSDDKISEKEIIDKDCPTPDCGSFISYISIEKPEGEHKKEFSSDQRPPKQAGVIIRMKSTSLYNIARRREQKELKRQKKAERRQALANHVRFSVQPVAEKDGDGQGEEGDRNGDNNAEGVEPAVMAAALPATDNMVILLKGDVAREEQKYHVFQKTVRQKKKKEKKEKAQVVNVELNFSDHPDRERFAGYDVDGDLEEETVTVAVDTWKKPTPKPAAPVQAKKEPPPPPVRRPGESFSKVASMPPQNSSQSQKDEIIKKTFTKFIQDILEAEGPQRMEEIEQREVVQDIPEETYRVIQQYGGLRGYFEKNCAFAVCGDFVGTRDDRDKVEELSNKFNIPPHPLPLMNSYTPNPDPYLAKQPVLDSVATARTKNAWDRDSTVMNVDAQPMMRMRTSDSYCAINGEMTLPRIEHELNPKAPVFQPSSKKEMESMNDIDDIDLGSCSQAALSVALSQPHAGGGLDTLDSFTAPADDSDIEDASSMNRKCTVPALDVNDIDEVDIVPSSSQSLPNLEDAVPGQSAHGGMSQRSSMSDLSQSGSDFSTGMLFRTTSPSSSASSHRNASTCDMGSPFVRDGGSPALCLTARIVDTTRQTGSPVSLTSVIPSIPRPETDRMGCELGQRSSSVSSVTSTFHNSMPHSVGSITTMGENSVNSITTASDPVHARSNSLPPVPKPLKPLALGGASSRLVGASAGLSGKSVGSLLGSASVSVAVCDGGVIVHSTRGVTTVSCVPVCVPTVFTSAFSVSVCSTSTLGGGLPSFASALTPEPTTSSIVGGSSSSPFGLTAGYSSLGLTSFSSSSSLVLNRGITSPSLTSTPTIPLSAALAREFVPSPSVLSRDYTLSSSPSKEFLSFTPSPWSGLASLPGSDTWDMETFPSSVRPSESIAPHLPTSSTVLSSLPPPIPYPASTWSSTMEDSVVSWQDAVSITHKAMLDEGVQASVQMRSTDTSTEMKLPDLSRMESMYNDLLLQNRDLTFHLQQLRQDLQSKEEERLSIWRDSEQAKADVQNLKQQMMDLSMDNTRKLEEKAAREDQLLGELQSCQQKLLWSNQELTNLLQKYAAMEEKCNQERHRAVHAECRVLLEQKENFNLTLKSKIKDVKRYEEEVMHSINSWNRTNAGQQVAEHQVAAIKQYFQEVCTCFANTLETVLVKLQQDQDNIMEGRTLAELVPVSSLSPPLPPLPEGLKRIIGLVSAPDTGDARQQPNSYPVPEASWDPIASVNASSSAAANRPMGGGLSGLSQPPPLRPPMAVSRPPGITRAGMGLSQLVSAGMMPMAKPPQPTLADTAAAAVAKGTPAPLRPIGFGKGLPGATQRAAPPLAARQPELSASATKPLTSFDRIVQYLQKSFPSVEREVFSQCLHQLRQANKNGSLSGMPMDKMVQRIYQMLVARGYKPTGSTSMPSSVNPNTNSNNNNGWAVKRTAPPPGISPAWNVEGLEPVDTDKFVEEEEDPCAICTDELSSGHVQTLDCGHRFHDDCIRKWFRQQTTCPKCRLHAPLQEDFPLLK